MSRSALAVKGAPQALIWVSGLGEKAVDQSVLTVAHRVAVALDREAGVAGATFPVRPGVGTQAFGPDSNLHTEVCTISRQDPGGEAAPIIDVYRLDVQGPLSEHFMKSGGRRRALLTLDALRIYRGRALRRGRKIAKTKKERRQALFSQLYISLFFLYLLFLLGSAIATVRPPTDPLVRYLAYGPALLMTVVGVSKASALSALVDATASMVSAVRYINGAEGRDVLRGRFSSLLERMSESPKRSYDDIKVIAYSFGSLVAIDALFPGGRAASPRYEKMSALATIGCPFDYVRTYWPGYFQDRYVTAHAPMSWLNVCRIGDVFGSNFRDDAAADVALQSVGTVANQPDPPKPQNRFYPSGDQGGEPSFLGTVALVGLQRHTMYWEGAQASTEDAFSLIVPDLYRGTPVLA